MAGMNERMGYLSPSIYSFDKMVAARLYRTSSVIRGHVYTVRIIHVLRSLFPPVADRRSVLRMRPHPFTLPLKDNKNSTPREFRALARDELVLNLAFPQTFDNEVLNICV